MHKRYCTIPKIPWFRNWFESKFGDLCEAHDVQYGIIKNGDDNMDKVRLKLESDYDFAREVALRGYPTLALLSLWFFKMRFVGARIGVKI